MPKRAKTLQTNFAAGELAPELALRRDTKQYRDGAASLLNNRVLIAGGVRRRPGTKRITQLAGDPRFIDFVVNSSISYMLVFTDGRMDAQRRNVATPGLLSAAGSLTSCPWTGTKSKTMDAVSSGNTMIVTHDDFLRVITRTGETTWSLGSFPFYTSPSGRIHQPHFKIAPQSVTITPSALTGSVTLTASTSWWTTGHVGKRVRIFNRELEITGYTSATQVTATVKETLRPFQTLTVTDSTGFALDEVVEGKDSSAKGVIIDIPDGTTITVAIIELFTKFDVEDLIGPNATTAIGSVADASPGAVKDWTEQLYSDENGWPHCVEIHRGRVLLAGSNAAPSAIAGSSINNVFDFDVGTGGDADGFLETIGDASAVSIVQMHSAEQLIVLTDKGPYYVPESAASPFRPSNLAFNHFGDQWEFADVRAFAFDGGVVAISGSIIVKMSPTGTQSAQWEASERSFLSPHLVVTPVDACVTTNYAGGAERYHVSVNSDGTLVVMQLVDAEQIRNFVPWTTQGQYRTVCSLGGYLYAGVAREIDGVTEYWLELFGDEYTLDGVLEYETEADMTTGVTTVFGNEEVHVVAGSFWLGVYPPALDELPAGPYRVGFFYERRIQTLPPNIQDAEGDHYGDPKRILRAEVDVLESARFAANGYELMAYRIGEDANLAPPVRTGPQRFRFLGWSQEPSITITQPDPLPLTIRGIKTEVAY